MRCMIFVVARGLYVAALVHHEGRILVTGDDVVPMIEVDSEFSSASLNADLYWLMKVTVANLHSGQLSLLP